MLDHPKYEDRWYLVCRDGVRGTPQKTGEITILICGEFSDLSSDRAVFVNVITGERLSPEEVREFLPTLNRGNDNTVVV